MLDLINYQNKCRIIRGWDDLFNKVKEHINSVSAMKLSPYYKVQILFTCLFSLFNVIGSNQLKNRIPIVCKKKWSNYNYGNIIIGFNLPE